MKRNIKTDNYFENVSNLNVANLTVTAQPRALPSNIPSSIGFVGREDYLIRLRDWYTAGKRCFVLHGMGGAGKTEIAKKFAYEVLDKYDAHIFLDLLGAGGNPMTTPNAMWQIISEFNPQAQRPQIPLSDPQTGRKFTAADQTVMEMNVLQGEYNNLLNKHNILIVLDNAGDEAQISAFNELNDDCLIVTARHRLYLDGCEATNVEEMSAEDAIDLLERKLGKERFKGEVENIAKLCGYLPLALRAAEGILFNKLRLSAVSYAKQLETTRLKLHNPKRGISVEAAFDLSYDYLKTEYQSRLRQLAVFPADFDEFAAAAVWEVEVETAEDVLAELESYGLIKWNEITERYKLHDLMREHADEKLSDKGERFQAQILFAGYFASILDRADKMQQNKEENYYSNALKLIDTEWDNITAGQKWTAENFEKDNRIAGLCTAYSGYGREFTTLRLNPRQDIKKWLEIGLMAAQRVNNRQAEGSSLGNLGLAYYRLGEYRKAIDYHEQFLAISREIGDRLGEGVGLGNLGLAYNSLGEYRKAIDYHEQFLAISREIGNRWSEGISLGNLGLTYYRLGEYRKAIDYQEQALAIAREIGDRSGKGNSLGNLGNAYQSLGEYPKAIDYYEQSLAIADEIGDRSGEGISLGNLGIIYDCLGDHRKAIDYHEQSLAIARQIGNRSGEGIDLGNLGNAYNRLGRYRKAIDYYEQFLAIAREIGDHLGEGISLDNLGNAYQSLGEVEKACGLWKEALAIFEAIESPISNVVRQLIEENCEN
jgi:tetratricopeptide (TPR) repeat protein